MAKRLFLILPFLLLTSAAASSSAEPDHDRARAAVESGRSQPLSALLDKVAASYPGKVLQVELEGDEDNLAYEVKLLSTDGSLQVLHYDAASLDLLRVESGKRRHGEHREH